MMALAVVAMAMGAQANAIKWGVSVVSPSKGTTGNTDYTAYLFISGDTSKTFTEYTVASITSELSKGNTKVLANALTSADATSIVTTGSNTGKMTWTTQTADSTLAAGNTLAAFLIIVDDKSENYLVAQASGSSVLSKTVASGSSNAYNFAFNSQASNTNWQAIPEPTSAMLMLLGMAGLALRRRRA